MTQEFAETPIIGQQGEIPSHSFFRKTKKACILLHFCSIILFKVKAVLSNLSEDKFFITILRNIREVNGIMRFLYPKCWRNRWAAQHAGGGYNNRSN